MSSSSSSSCTSFPSPSSSSRSAFLSLSCVMPSTLLIRFARSSILSVLEAAITIGSLTISDAGGIHHYGSVQSCNHVNLTVLNDNFWYRILLSGDIGFSEAYMIGEIICSDLKGIMNLWLDNQAAMEQSLSSIFTKISTAASALYNSFFGQTISQARLNAIASYDQSNELFKAFLSKEMMYSCALWSDEEGSFRGDLEGRSAPGDLESAQLRKIRHVLRLANVRPGHRILEFGSGWGGLAIEAARNFGCEVDTITLSSEQKALADERIQAEGLHDKVRVHLLDYREIPSHFEKSFDAFISIEMIEHVGPKYYNTYFKLVDFALKSKDARIVLSSTTYPESRYSNYQAEDFMRKYMWPNSCLPSATALITSAQTACEGRFTLHSVENHSAHYPRTLREWGQRLEENLVQETIAQEYPALNDPATYEAFKRKWQYLFAYAGAGFSKGYITCHMMCFHRQNDPPPHCD